MAYVLPSRSDVGVFLGLTRRSKFPVSSSELLTARSCKREMPSPMYSARRDLAFSGDYDGCL